MQFTLVLLQAVVTVICRGNLDDLQVLKDLLKEMDWFCQVSATQASRREEQDRRRTKAKAIYKNILQNKATSFQIDLTPDDGALVTLGLLGSRSEQYTVTASVGGVTCTCMDSQNGRLCKHKMALAGVLYNYLPHVASHLGAQFVMPVKRNQKTNAA